MFRLPTAAADFTCAQAMLAKADVSGDVDVYV